MTLNTVQQNKVQTQTPQTMGATINNESTTREPPPYIERTASNQSHQVLTLIHTGLLRQLNLVIIQQAFAGHGAAAKLKFRS